jgi:hypothetical protein
MFGSYCKVHAENTPTNSMKSRGIPAICLGPTGNSQGTYSFLNLAMGLVIKRRQFTELPAPDSVIKRVATLAQKTGVSPRSLEKLKLCHKLMVEADFHLRPLHTSMVDI